MTTGTNTPLILSASRAMGALEVPASSTRRIIWARVVSSPTLEARNWKLPFLLMVAESTWSPGPFSTGRLSPVMAAWSTKPWPEITSPSTGMLSPGRMTTRSPARTCSAGMVCSCPFRTTVAVLGARSMSLSRALEVLALERLSRYLPTVTRVTIMAEDSKYRSWAYWCTSPKSPWPKPQAMRYMANTP